MRFQENVSNLCKNISRKFPLIYNIRKVLPDKIKRTVYYSLIYPLILYNTPFVVCNKSYIRNLEKKHKKIIKILFNKNRRTPIEDLYKYTNLKPIEEIIKYSLDKIATKIKNKKVSNKILSNFNSSSIRERRFKLSYTSIKYSYTNELVKLMNNC